jgi:preprotein translocase subunit SecF
MGEEPLPCGLVFGLAADLMNTYLLNVDILRYYKYEGVAR